MHKVIGKSFGIWAGLLLLAPALWAAPQATFDHFTNNLTTEVMPHLSGKATAEGATLISSVECRIDGGSWTAAQGAMNLNTVSFTFEVTSALVRSTTAHLFEVRCTDNAGMVSTPTSYYAYIIGNRPEISLKANRTAIVSGDPIDKSPLFEVKAITDKTLSAFTLKINGTEHILTDTEIDNPKIYIGQYQPSPSLSDGTYTIRAEAFDSAGQAATQEATHLLVQSAQAVDVQNVPLNYPNPFNPDIQSTYISYTLSKSAAINLKIYDLMGTLVYQQIYAKDSAGGSAGYNEVEWTGKSGSGVAAGNGLYLFLIMSDGTLLSKGKLAVIR